MTAQDLSGRDAPAPTSIQEYSVLEGCPSTYINKDAPAPISIYEYSSKTDLVLGCPSTYINRDAPAPISIYEY